GSTFVDDWIMDVGTVFRSSLEDDWIDLYTGNLFLPNDTEQPDAVVYDVDTVTGEGHEPVSVEDLEKQNATASRLDKMENSAGGFQSNNDTWKTTVLLTPTVDRTDLDPMVTITGGCRPTNATTEQVGKGAGFKDVTVNGEGYKHVESLEWKNAATSKFENRPAIDKRAGQWKVVAAQKSEAQGVQNAALGVLKNAEALNADKRVEKSMDALSQEHSTNKMMSNEQQIVTNDRQTCDAQCEHDKEEEFENNLEDSDEESDHGSYTSIEEAVDMRNKQVSCYWCTTSKFENRPAIDKRAGQWKVVAA
ncbi:hypothetical protein A4A49_23923, partial [Nicotiana attenuata]